MRITLDLLTFTERSLHYFKTGGFDLVLVSNEIEFLPSASINTTPPLLPASTPIQGGYDYGYGRQGYRGGDIIILSPRIYGELSLQTAGGEGQAGAPGQQSDLSCTESMVKCLLDEPFSSPLNPSKCHAWNGLPFMIGVRIIPNPNLTYDAKYYCTGSTTHAGQGGAGGNITITGADLPLNIININQGGGAAGKNGLTEGPAPVGPEAIRYSTSPRVDMRNVYENENNHGHAEQIQCVKSEHADQVKIDFFRQFSNSEERPWCIEYPNGTHIGSEAPWAYDAGPGFDCSLSHDSEFYEKFQQFNCHVYNRTLGGSGVQTYCTVNFTNNCVNEMHRHCNVDENNNNINCSSYDLPFYLINNSKVEAGVNGNLKWYQVSTPSLLKKFHEGIADSENSFDINSAPHPLTGMGEKSGDWSQSDYLTALAAFAPRAADLLLIRADFIYRSLLDSDLSSKDSLYQNDPTRNPSAQNQILKAQYLYDSILYFDAEAINQVQTNETSFEKKIPADYVFRDQILLAYSQKMKLLQGINYYGLGQDFYVYLRPDDITPYYNQIQYVAEGATSKYQNALNNYSILVNHKDETLLTLIIPSDFEAQVYNDELAAQIQRVKARAFEMNSTLQKMQTNMQNINNTFGEDVEDKLPGMR